MIDLPQDHLAIVKDILQQYIPNRAVWAFGSRVKGTTQKHSDLDLCIFGKPLSISEITSLREAFSESNLPFRIDIVQWKEISKDFQAVVKKSHTVLQND